MPRPVDVVCVGAGVIGLMTADRLARQGHAVTVVDQGPLAQQASWAGAGILPPPLAPKPGQSLHPLDEFYSRSVEQFPDLAQSLLDDTGQDIGFLVTGGLEIARQPSHALPLQQLQQRWKKAGVQLASLDEHALKRLEPHFDASASLALHLPQMAQVRNPRLLKALIARCEQRGVTLRAHQPVRQLQLDHDRVTGVMLQDQTVISAPHVLLCAGAWTADLLPARIPRPDIHPVRGQILMLETTPGTVQSVILEDKRYLVPRPDGLVLVGSTEENVGFDAHPTPHALSALRHFAQQLVPALTHARQIHAWAGLRPGAPRPFPYLGPVEGVDGLWLAAGHFRRGLQLAPATSQLLTDWITQQPAFLDPHHFALASPHADYQPLFNS